MAGHNATVKIVQITVDPDRVLNRITPAMYGACIEDVNHEIYGALYAQRIFRRKKTGTVRGIAFCATIQFSGASPKPH